jgi:RNA polymerase sigma-70 factor, ECF subfamily
MSAVINPTPQLVERALAGEGEACGQLFDLLAGDVQRFVVGLRLPLTQQDVEDTVQETFLRLLRDLSRLAPGKGIKPFALGIARHVGLDLCRRREVRERGRSEAAPDALPGATPGGAEQAAQREASDLVGRALEALEPEHRSLIVLRHVNGLRMQELADTLNCSLPTARLRLRAAGHLLAAELRRLGLVPGQQGGDL